ncbi:hypothetical protein ACFLYA_00100 [Candidatus Dependentiae bacterium]
MKKLIIAFCCIVSLTSVSHIFCCSGSWFKRSYEMMLMCDQDRIEKLKSVETVAKKAANEVIKQIPVEEMKRMVSSVVNIVVSLEFDNEMLAKLLASEGKIQLIKIRVPIEIKS